MLNFIASAIWTRLFGHSAELLKGTEALEFGRISGRWVVGGDPKKVVLGAFLAMEHANFQ